MALPISTIAFAIATAIPFGLAIKDTATGKYDKPDRDAYLDFGRQDRFGGDVEVDEDELEQYGQEQEAMMVRREADRIEAERQLEAERAKLRNTLRGLYGAEVASMGTLFGDTKLDGPRLDVGVPAGLRDADLDPVYLDDGVTRYGVYLNVGRDSDCDALVTQLTSAWGEQKYVGGRAVWLNPTTGQRAIVDSQGACALQFERVSPIEAWLSKSKDAVVPMGIIGTSAKALTDRLGDRASVDGDELRWHGLGLGVGYEPTTITAFVKGGRVVGLVASLKVDEVTLAAVEARVSQLVGKRSDTKTEDETTVWKSVPKVTLDPSATTMFLHIGEQLDQ